jgi:hypothetical protein
VIDLVFLPTESILFDTHAILPDNRGPSDHAPLVFTAQGPDSRVPLTRWCIPRDSKEEEAFLKEASASLLALAPPAGGLSTRVGGGGSGHLLRLLFGVGKPRQGILPRQALERVVFGGVPGCPLQVLVDPGSWGLETLQARYARC